MLARLGQSLTIKTESFIQKSAKPLLAPNRSNKNQNVQRMGQNQCVKTPNLVKLGQDLTSQHTCVYMCVYIYAVKLLTGPRLAILIVTNWATLIVTNWATSFSHYKNRGFK